MLALLRGEPGDDAVTAHIGRATISAVNRQEVTREMLREGAVRERVRPVLDAFGLDVRPHDTEATHAAAALSGQTKRRRRGLGDRACLALELQIGLPVLTADRAWGQVEVEGFEVELVR